MELNERQIKDQIDMVMKSFREDVDNQVLRPSGMLRRPSTGLIPRGPAAQSLRAALTIADLRDAVMTTNAHRNVFLFICGYHHYRHNDVREVLSGMLTNYYEQGYKNLTPATLAALEQALDPHIKRHEHGPAVPTDEGSSERNFRTGAICWVLGERMSKYVSDGVALDKIFTKEWLGGSDE